MKSKKTDQEQTYFLVYKGVKENDDHTVQVEIKPFNEELAYLQQLVGGTIEHFIIDRELCDKRIDMWIDDEGKLKRGLKPTWSLCDPSGQTYDVIFGNCVFSKFDDEGYTHGLTAEEVQDVIHFLLSRPRAYIEDKRTGRKLGSLLVQMMC